jgi:uncharacterized MAPEG superfamily protein
MYGIPEHPPLYWYALCAVVLFGKMLVLSLFQGYYRIGKGKFKNPEDARVTGREPVDEELPQVQRAARAWLNDLENIPIFLALGIAYVQLGCAPQLAPWLFGGFTLARILHSLCYLLGLQPWRTLAYVGGIVATAWLCVEILLTIPPL